MSPDTLTEITGRNVFERFGGSVKGILIGVILFVISFPVLWTNEGRAVRRARTLQEGAGAVVSVSAEQVDARHEGALVHLTGEAATDEVLRDPDFAVSANAIKLRREAEMYQWDERTEKETKRKVGGGEETRTTYHYAMSWRPTAVDSSGFRHPEGHGNPGEMRYRPRITAAADVRVGAFQLSGSLIDRIDAYEGMAVDASALEPLLPEVRERAHVTGAGIYLGKDPGAPAVGDLRISFSRVPATTVSLIAKQVGNGFESFTTKEGRIELLAIGALDAATLFEMEEQKNRALTWVLRLVGFALMAIGLVLLAGPLAVLADVVPIFGSLVRGATVVAAGLLAVVLSLITMAVAWIVYRPWLGVSLLVIAALGIVGLRHLARDQDAPAPPPPPPGPPPPE